MAKKKSYKGLKICTCKMVECYRKNAFGEYLCGHCDKKLNQKVKDSISNNS